MPNYRVTWEVDVKADCPRKAADKALVMLHIMDDPSKVFHVREQWIVGVTREFADDGVTVDLSEEETTKPPILHHWELYERVAGWQECSARLDAALKAAMEKLEASCRDGVSPVSAALTAYNDVVAVMDRPENNGFGAGDTEPRAFLARQIKRYLKASYPEAADRFYS